MKFAKPRVYFFLLILIILTAGVFYLTVKKSDFTGLIPADIIIWTLAAVLSESLSVYYASGNVFISPIEAVFYGCCLSCGPLTACICIFLTFLFIVTRDENRLRHIFNTPARYIIFNISHQMLIMLLLYFIYRLLTTALLGLQIVPAIITAPLFFSLSCIINALFFRIEDGTSFKQTFVELFHPYYQAAVPASLAAVIIAMAYASYRYLAILILITPLFITLLSMRTEAGKSR